jgi:WD40 repeat protein
MKLNLLLSNRVLRSLFAASLGLAILPASVAAFPAPQWMVGGHGARVTGVASSPDGSMIASSSEDGTVKLWSTNGALLRTLSTQTNPATAVAWSPDGTKVLAGTYYGGFISSSGLGLTYLWSAPSASQSAWTGAGVSLTRVTTNHYGKVTAVAFSSTALGRMATGGIEGSNYVTTVSGSYVNYLQAYGNWTITSPTITTYSNRPAPVTSVAFSSAGYVASGCEDATIRVYDSSSRQLWYSTNSHLTNVSCVAFSPDGSYLATASLDQTVKIWYVSDWSLLRTYTGHNNGVTSIAFSPDGNSIVSGSIDGTLQVWDWISTNCLVAFPAHALPVTTVRFSKDGSLVISGSDDATVRLWSAADGSAVCTLGGQNSFIGAVAISPDGTLCASAGGNETVQVRNTSDGSLVQTLSANTNYVSSLAFSPDSARLASGGGPLDPTIKIWQLSNGALLQTVPATTNGVMALAWSPDGLTLASGGDSVEQNISFWNTNGVLQGTLPGTASLHTNGVTALAFSPQGNLLASGGRRPGNFVQVWTNITPGGIWTTGAVTRSFTTLLSTPVQNLNTVVLSWNNNVECVAFSPDGGSVAFGSSGTNLLYVGLISNGSVQKLGGTGINPLSSVAFSPNASKLAATDQSTLNLWTNTGPSTWTLSETVTNEVVQPSSLAYSPNGNLLMWGRNDGTVAMSPTSLAALPVRVGAASNPSPANGATGVVLNPTLSWTPGSNALTHAIYLGFGSNTVAQATPASPEYQGVTASSSFAPALVANSTYFWRVDEMAGLSNTVGVVWSFATAPPPPLGLVHRYTFSETGGTTVADSVGGSSWNGTLPNGGTFSNGQLTLASSSSQYVLLPAGIMSTVSNFTIEVWAELNSTASGARLFDFGNSTGDYMFLTPQSSSTNKLRFAILTSGNSEQDINGTNALSAGAWYHVVVTLNGNTGIVYVNGAAVGTNSAMTLNPSGMGSTTNNWLGRSEFSSTYLNGALDEFRIYNVTLSPAQIAATDMLGPSQTLSTNSPNINLTASQTNLTLSWPLASAGFTLQSCTSLTDGNWVNVSSPAPQIVGTNFQFTLTPTNAAQFYRLSW